MQKKLKVQISYLIKTMRQKAVRNQGNRVKSIKGRLELGYQ